MLFARISGHRFLSPLLTVPLRGVARQSRRLLDDFTVFSLRGVQVPLLPPRGCGPVLDKVVDVPIVVQCVDMMVDVPVVQCSCCRSYSAAMHCFSDKVFYLPVIVQVQGMVQTVQILCSSWTRFMTPVVVLRQVLGV